MAKGKRTTAIREGIDRDKTYPLEEAVNMLKDRAKSKFDEKIEIAMNHGGRTRPRATGGRTQSRADARADANRYGDPGVLWPERETPGYK